MGNITENKEASSEVAGILLRTGAVRLNVKEPFTFVSGIRSPIYCDNRILISFPEERRIISRMFNNIVRKAGPDAVAGVASSAVPWASWVAEGLGLPMCYIRKKAKDYGKEEVIEGMDISGKRVVVIEDLVSTGGSSMNAVQACRDAGAEVLGLAAIFTYGFEKARELFRKNSCTTYFLTDFRTLIKNAAESRIIEKSMIDRVMEWSAEPSGWGPKYGFPLGQKKN